LKKLILLSILLFSLVCSSLAQNRHSAPADTPSTVDSLINKAVEMESYDADSALKLYEKAYALAEKMNYTEGKFRYARNVTVVLNDLGRLEESRSINEKAVMLSRELNDSINLAKNLFNLANVYNAKGEFYTALELYLEAEAIFSSLNIHTYKNLLYGNLAVLFEEIKEFDKALDYLQRGYTESVEAGDTVGILDALNNMVMVLNQINQFDTAAVVAESALNLLTNFPSPKHKSTILLNYGTSLNGLKQYSKALEKLKESERISSELNNLRSVAIAQHGLALSYFNLGNYNLAEKHIDLAEKLAANTQAYTTLDQIYHLRASIKAARGNYKTAYASLQAFVTLRDSLNNESVRAKSNELERKFRLKEMQQELEYSKQMMVLHEQEIRNKQTWVALLITGIALLSMYILLFARLSAKKQKYQDQQLKALQKEKELSELQSAILAREEERKRIAAELHDEIGSGLTAILFLAEKEKRNTGEKEGLNKISGNVSQLMGKVNEIVWSMNASCDSLEELATYIRYKMAGFCENVGLEFITDIQENFPEKEIPGEARRNIYLIVKEAFNNIAKHAGATQAFLKISADEQGMEITVKDNGKGIIRNTDGVGNGLKNMQDRSAKLNGKLEISANDGTELRLEIPFEGNYNLSYNTLLPYTK
jgi:two-component system NarL family sensor kinase